MNYKKLSSFAVPLTAITLIAATSWGSICQVYSATWNTTLNCGVAARGWGKGTSVGGNKVLEAFKGTQAGTRSVGAVGVKSNGSSISNCRAIDSTNNGLSVGVFGGDCNLGVKFAVQIDYD